MSLLSWERGLKFAVVAHWVVLQCVAPLVGAWIEMFNAVPATPNAITVAPLVGAWIEIYRPPGHPIRELFVAPLVGAWIEMQSN